jgi:hypothetical protein
LLSVPQPLPSRSCSKQPPSIHDPEMPIILYD